MQIKEDFCFACRGARHEEAVLRGPQPHGRCDEHQPAPPGRQVTNEMTEVQREGRGQQAPGGEIADERGTRHVAEQQQPARPLERLEGGANESEEI